MYVEYVCGVMPLGNFKLSLVLDVSRANEAKPYRNVGFVTDRFFVDTFWGGFYGND